MDRFTFNANNYIHPDWEDTMSQLFNNVVAKCIESNVFNVETLRRETRILKESALTNGLDEEACRKKEKNDTQKLKRWLEKDYLQFCNKIGEALAAALAARQQVAAQDQEPDEGEPDRGTEGPDAILVSEPDNLAEMLEVHFDSQGDVSPDDLLRYQAIFRRELNHCPLTIEYGLIGEGNEIAPGQVYLGASAWKLALLPGGGLNQHHIQINNMHSLGSVVNLLHYQVSVANLETATSYIFGPTGHGQETQLLEKLAGELSIPRPHISLDCLDAVMDLILIWLGTPEYQEAQELSVDCSVLGIKEVLSKLQLRSGHTLVLCTHCEPRKCRIPYLTWPEFMEAASSGSFATETGICTLDNCGRLAFRSKRLNGSSLFVLAPEPENGQGIPVMDAALLHQAPGYVDMAKIDSNELRCQGSLVWSTSGMVAVVRGRQGPWRCIHPTEPEEAQSAEGVMGQAMAFFFSSN